MPEDGTASNMQVDLTDVSLPLISAFFTNTPNINEFSGGAGHKPQ